MSYTKEQRVINSMLNSTSKERSQPVMNKDTEGFVIPNHSGDHKGGTKRDTPVNDLDLVNKKYVDDNIPIKTSDISRVRAYQSSAQTIPSSSITIVELQTKDYDNLGEFDNSTNYRFTATKAGYYLINGCVSISSLTDTKALTCWIYKNGVGIARNFTRSSANESYSADVFTIVYLDISDYIDLRIYHNEGSDLNLLALSNSTYFEVHRLS